MVLVCMYGSRCRGFESQLSYRWKNLDFLGDMLGYFNSGNDCNGGYYGCCYGGYCNSYYDGFYNNHIFYWFYFNYGQKIFMDKNSQGLSIYL